VAPSLKYHFINLNLAIQRSIEPDVLEDNERFCLKQKQKLLQKFLLFRLCNYLIQQVCSIRNKKIVVVVSKLCKFEHIQDQEIYFLKMLKSACKLLGIVIVETSLSYEKFIELLGSSTGESRELKNKVNAAYAKQKHIPYLEKFYKMLATKGIYKIQESVNGNINVKLGLFVT